MSSTPFEVLGLAPDATAEDVRSARRRLAKLHHPDTGGDAVAMRRVNEAAAAALRAIAARVDAGADEGVAPRSGSTGTRPGRERDAPDTTTAGTRPVVVSDHPSFVIEALPAEAFEALRVVAGWIGEVLDDDPPYRLDVELDDPVRCWCRLDLVPDAGSSTVSITVVFPDRRRVVDIEDVRDTWISNLNQLDWQ